MSKSRQIVCGIEFVFFWQIVKLTAKFLFNESGNGFYSVLLFKLLVSVAFLSSFYVKLLPAESLHQKENTKTQWATIHQFPFQNYNTQEGCKAKGLKTHTIYCEFKPLDLVLASPCPDFQPFLTFLIFPPLN